MTYWCPHYQVHEANEVIFQFNETIFIFDYWLVSLNLKQRIVGAEVVSGI